MMTLTVLGSPNCAPCRVVKNLLSSVVLPADVRVRHVNVEEDHETAQQFRVRTLPTLLVLDESEQVLASRVGSITEAALNDLIAEARR